MKKLTRVFLAVVCCAALLAGCGDSVSVEKDPPEASSPLTAPENEKTQAGDPFGRYDETVVIKVARAVNPNVTYPEGDSIEDNAYVRDILKELNIKVEYDWVSSEADFDQKMNLAISSNTIPDAVMVNPTQFQSMREFNLIEPLDGAFEQYGSEMLKSFYVSGGEALAQLCTDNGSMMAVPAPKVKSNGFYAMWIRQDWLNEMNLQVPTTMEELKAVAKAFAGRDRDVVGIIGPDRGRDLTRQVDNSFGFDPIFAAYRSFPQYYLRDESGEIVYGSTAPETKKALAELASMYAEGMIDPEMMIRENSLQLALDNKGGIFFAPWWMGYNLADAYWQENPADWQAYTPPLADDGKLYAHMPPPSDAFLVVRKGYEHPEAAIKIINLLLRDEPEWVEEGIVDSIGLGWVYPLFSVFDNSDEIEVSYELLTQFLEGKITMEDVDFSTHKLLKGDMKAIEILKKEPLTDFSIQKWDLKNEIAPSNLPRLISIMVGGKPLATVEDLVEIYSLTYTRTDTMVSRQASLDRMEEEVFTKIIMGQEPVDSFDRFVSDWLAQGGSQILKEVGELVD